MRLLSQTDPLAFDTRRSIFGRSPAALLALVVALGAVTSARAETPREHCRAATSAAPRAAAIAACDRALLQRGGAEDLWAAAHVRLSRPEPPTMDDLVRADLLAAAATRLEPGQPWGALARFELARRWGDPALVARELSQLERVAPAHEATLRAAASVRPHLPLRLAIGWALVLAACAVTLTHALFRRGATTPRAGVPTALVVLVAAATLLGRPSVAAAAFVVDDHDPERSVPSPAAADASPIEFAYYLQDLGDRAIAASARGDHAAAIRYLRALARAVPDASVPQQKLCAALEAHGDHDAAIAACRAALGLSGVRAQDFVRFGELVLALPAPSAAALADVEAGARHLMAQPDARVLGLELACRVGVKRGDLPLLDECSRELATAAPNDPSTWVFAWTAAKKHGRTDEARRFVARARAAGLPPDAQARMESVNGRASPRAALVLAGAGLGVLGLAVLLLRRRRRASAPSSALT
ncbi:MAG: hypothetical protein ACXVDD_06350 [Polyangia bacterium]